MNKRLKNWMKKKSGSNLTQDLELIISTIQIWWWIRTTKKFGKSSITTWRHSTGQMDVLTTFGNQLSIIQ
jgi:hypothetical protein